MAKVGAASRKFEGGQASIAQMGTLAQAARGRGGSASASSAATSVLAFAEMFSKGKRIAAFEKMGVNLQGEGGRVRDPKKIIMDSLLAAQTHNGGQLGNGWDKNFSTMFQSSQARKATASFEDKFKQAGGGEAGVKAASEEFDRLTRAMISNEEVQSSFERAMKTNASQAEVFNNAIRKTALQMVSDLTPAMIGLGQAVLPLVRQFGGIVSLATGDKSGDVLRDTANADVKEALASTAKQTAGGQISDAQLDQNTEAAKQALWSKQKAEADLAGAQDTLKAKKGDAQSEYSWWNAPGKTLGYAWDKTLGTDEKGAAAAVEEKKKNLAEANATYEKMVSTNEDIKRKLDGHLIVRIANVEELKAAMGPTVGGGGRTPSPEEKADR
jgi:hypothetical protein